MFLRIFLSYLVVTCAQSKNNNRYPTLPEFTDVFQNQPFASADVGSPLILTDYIERGELEKAKKLSEVKLPGFNIESYSGFFRVNSTEDKKYSSALFFWFFPAEEYPSNAPVLLWLNAGLGSSSMTGLFQENGPLQLNKNKKRQPLPYVEKRKTYWSKNHNVIYIDNPVGRGFSFAEDYDLYSRNKTQVGLNLYIALVQFFKVFNEYQRNDFFITGETYIGQFGTSLGFNIYQNNPVTDIKINLKGFALGNDLTDPLYMMLYSKYLYQVGLIDDNGRKLFEYKEKQITDLIFQKKLEEAFDVYDELIVGTFHDKTIYNTLTNFTNLYNYQVPIADNTPNTLMVELFNTTTFRKAVHVGNTTYDTSVTEDVFLKNDIMGSVKGNIENILDSRNPSYRVLFYSGQLDVIVAYPFTENFLRNLDFGEKETYLTASREFVYYKNELKGYVKKAKNLYEVLVFNASHLVPRDQPDFALDMITQFTRGINLFQ
ncbi:hypothetical protein M8J76_005663 [Diaphorina citri]|nr:hypothetical protein M8J75_015201 [Diaphorina citri]KAI5723421.1 hypothetical protein M8J76_005663 [Diaphorina citri]KAI5728257.1 hypothetical protein M8J77_013690 [Diaphorina citri]